MFIIIQAVIIPIRYKRTRPNVTLLTKCTLVKLGVNANHTASNNKRGAAHAIESMYMYLAYNYLELSCTYIYVYLSAIIAVNIAALAAWCDAHTSAVLHPIFPCTLVVLPVYVYCT